MSEFDQAALVIIDVQNAIDASYHAVHGPRNNMDADSPILNLRLPDGSRLAAMIPPVVNPRPLVTIRRFTHRNFTLDDLIRIEMLTQDQAAALTDAVREGQNILIAGGTASGKSTLLGTLADAISEHERILLIEDTAELHIRKPHVVSAESQTDIGVKIEQAVRPLAINSRCVEDVVPTLDGKISFDR
jgi:Flp pilus assembly CpaF family ATPase